MRFAKLIRRNLVRNPMRAFLMITLMSAIFFLVASLIQIIVALEELGGDAAGTDRIVVQSAFSLATMLPYAHEDVIRRTPGVLDVAKSQWLGGTYRDAHNLAVLAMDANRFSSVFPDYGLSSEEDQAWKNDRRGALVGEGMVRRFGWKVGQRITITRELFPFDPEVTIRGITHHPVQKDVVFVHMDYFNETMKWNRCGAFWTRVADKNRMAQISQAIDATFKNSPDPTETFTEKEFNRQFVNMFGNVKFLLTSISVCSVFMMVLLAAITMTMAARERVTEVAVLKAIGFPRALVLRLMLTEFVAMTLVGCAVGTGGAVLLFHYVDIAPLVMGMLPNFHIELSTQAICLAIAMFVGLVAGGLPSVKAANLRVVDGLRKVV